MCIDSLVNYNVIVLSREGEWMQKLLENKKNMKNVVIQYKLLMIIKELQKENFLLKQNIDELSNELEETKENIYAKRLVL